MTLAQFEILDDGLKLAYRQDGSGEDLGRTGFFWLGGFKSSMTGTKAEAVAGLARQTRRPSFRFDYSGHGESSGLFADGTITAWLDQSLHMFLARAPGKRVIIASSMGGWLAMLLIRKLRLDGHRALNRIAGLVLIAPAADMTLDLMWNRLPEEDRRELAEKGVCMRASDHGEALPITAKLIEDGDRHLILKEGLGCPCPVRILQGDLDADVPPEHALKVFRALDGGDIALTLVKGGDHRLSSPGQLALLRETALRLAERADGTIL
jgi:pimeloyl-ACP methyl ester carboxylesterase